MAAIDGVTTGKHGAGTWLTGNTGNLVRIR